MLPITVFLPVYHKVPVAQFTRALESVRAQTRQASQVLIAVDGPVPDDLASAIRAAEDEHTEILWFPENRGLAVTFDAALEHVREPWIARQDSDDVSLPHRLETQWKMLETGKFAAVGAAMAEFEGDESNVVRIRRLPSSAEAAERYLRVNTPINNPTSILSTDRLRDVGGVRPVHFMEDYDVLARIVAAGGRIANSEEVLVLFRADPGMFSRRRDRGLLAAEWEMQNNLHRYGLISRPRMVVNFAMRTCFRMLPMGLFRKAYGVLFDRSSKDEKRLKGTAHAG